MKQSIVKFVAVYIIFVVLFVLQKPLFMLFHNSIYTGVPMTDYLSVIYHGLPLDFSLAGYLTIIPAILIIICQWSNSAVIKTIEKIYYMIISCIMSIVFCLDIALYQHWSTKLDATPLFYFFSSPAAAMASVSWIYILVGVFAILVVAALYYFIFRIILVRQKITFCRIPFSITFVMLLLTAALFIPIRGGFTVSTMNLSRAYFSQRQTLNHAAINPMFSLMYSATHQDDFGAQFRYFDNHEADNLFSRLIDTPCDSVRQLFTSHRPDIYLVIFESFSSHLMSSLGGSHPVAINLDSIASDGILFTDFYANGFRTDRALPAILSAYPSQPTTSIMKDVTKTDNLPSIPKALKQAGYDLSYYYGGDINFTNLGAFLVSSGFEKIVSDKDFAIADRLSKWGVHDHLVFKRCLDDVANAQQIARPQLRVIQTSSSHEPFDVPYDNPLYDEPRANAFAYADSCLGDFVRNLKKIGTWNNSLIIIVPDHYGAFPKGIENPVDRHRIPLIFAGGVIKQPVRIDITASQIDIAATLLAQLNLPHKQFLFSKNILNPQSPHFAFFVDPSQFGFAQKSGVVVYNCDADKIIYSQGDSIESLLCSGKAFLQKLYDDLDNR